MARAFRILKSRWAFLSCLTSLMIIAVIPRHASILLSSSEDKGIFSTFLGDYCFTGAPPEDYLEDEHIDDELYVQRCSLEDIDACQHIHNQTLLMRVHWTAGLASELNNLVRIFLYTIQSRRRFLIDGDSWNYGRFSVFFNTTQGRFSPWLPLSSDCLQRQFIHRIQYKPDPHEPDPPHFVLARDTSFGYIDIGPLATAWEKSSQILSMRRAVAGYLWQTLNNETRHAVQQYLDTMDADNITYAMHVRRGDKITEAVPIPAKSYIQALEKFMKKGDPVEKNHRIYLASDDPAAINEFREQKPEWQFVQLAPSKLRSGGHSQIAFDQQPVDIKQQMTILLIAELEILSRAKYVVCTFSSNVCRLVQILRKQDPDTVHSVDVKWHPR